MKQPSFPIESTYDALRRYLSNLRHLREIKTFSKKLPQKFGSFTENPYICTKNLKVGGYMDTLNKEFWEKRDAAMKRFMASKERKRKRMAELEQMLRQDYLARTGEEPKFVNVW